MTALGYLAVLIVLVTSFLKTPLPFTQPTVLKHLVNISMSIISMGTTQANDNDAMVALQVVRLANIKMSRKSKVTLSV